MNKTRVFFEEFNGVVTVSKQTLCRFDTEEKERIKKQPFTHIFEDGWVDEGDFINFYPDGSVEIGKNECRVKVHVEDETEFHHRFEAESVCYCRQNSFGKVITEYKDPWLLSSVSERVNFPTLATLDKDIVLMLKNKSLWRKAEAVFGAKVVSISTHKRRNSRTMMENEKE